MKNSIKFALVTTLALCAITASAESSNPSREGMPTRSPMMAQATYRQEVSNLRASTTAEIKNLRGEMMNVRASTTAAIMGMRANLQNERAQMEEQAKTLRASSTEMRANMKDRAQQARLNAAHKQTDMINARIAAAINRVQALSDRLSKALDTLSAKGVDVTASRAKLVEAATKLDQARTQASSLNLTIESAFASSTPRVAQTIQPLVKSVTQTIQAAHDLVIQAISLVKPGMNSENRTATTTQAAPVATPAATTTTSVATTTATTTQ